MASSWYDATHVLTHANQQKTTLTAFFKTCATIEAACQYTYQELYFINPSAGKYFYFRLLLTVVHDACMALDLLEDDNEWIYCLEKAAVMHNSTQLRIILSSHNDDVKHINLAVLDLFSGNERMYLSSDNATMDGVNNTNCLYSVEYLNSLNPTRMPPSKLTFKVGWQDDRKIELTLFILTNYKERDFDLQAIFEQDEFYSVRGEIIPGKYKDSMTVSSSIQLKILDKVPLLNKCPLKVSLISIPQEIPAELNDNKNSVFGILVNDYAIQKHNFIVKIVYSHLTPRFKCTKETI
ncbi:17866_t:CDS:2 [Cetraspora pellucida]|uniref:17866_t:CDS:1 n=1 Tax=Cetraspora pellucida TaxID=1433469 RepID=A0ACA9KLE0_9GLOM|nr:17866_t:CDS:2 [Cetraspora pellucida]